MTVEKISGHLVQTVIDGRTFYVDRNMWWDTGKKTPEEAFVHDTKSLTDIFSHMAEHTWKFPPQHLVPADYNPVTGKAEVTGEPILIEDYDILIL